MRLYRETAAVQMSTAVLSRVTWETSSTKRFRQFDWTTFHEITYRNTAAQTSAAELPGQKSLPTNPSFELFHEIIFRHPAALKCVAGFFLLVAYC